MERILLLEDDKSLVTGLTAALLAAECAAWAVCPALCLPLLGLFVLLSVPEPMRRPACWWALLPALCCTVHCIPG